MADTREKPWVRVLRIGGTAIAGTVLVLTILFIVVAYSTQPDLSGGGRDQDLSTKAVSNYAGVQKDRLRSIKAMKRDGHIDRISTAITDGPDVYVTDKFLQLGAAEKDEKLSIIYAFYQHADNEFGESLGGRMGSPMTIVRDDGSPGGKLIALYNHKGGYVPQ
jgi:hypothetical protein